jgi:hypothetical protein
LIDRSGGFQSRTAGFRAESSGFVRKSRASEAEPHVLAAEILPFVRRGNDLRAETLPFAKEGNSLETESLPFAKKGNDPRRKPFPFGTKGNDLEEISYDSIDKIEASASQLVVSNLKTAAS